MENRRKLTAEEIERIAGGTMKETAMPALELTSLDYGDFILPEDGPGGDFDIADVEAIKKFFAAKGFTFVPSEGADYFIGHNGRKFTQDEIPDMMDRGRI